MTLAEITTAVNSFVTAYDIWIAAGFVFGMGILVVRRLVKAGR